MGVTKGLDYDFPSVQRFVDLFVKYVDCVATEVHNRALEKKLDIDNYILERRHTSGGYLVLMLVEFAAQLPEDVILHPQVASLAEQGADMIILVNVRTHINHWLCG
jgi:Delta6-protoilludene synthase